MIAITAPSTTLPSGSATVRFGSIATGAALALSPATKLALPVLEVPSAGAELITLTL